MKAANHHSQGILSRKKDCITTNAALKASWCNKADKALHTAFKGGLKTYQLDPKHKNIIKELMTYTFDNITKEVRNQKTVIKKTLTEINTKIESIEERYAIGDIESTIYKKFKDKYETQKEVLQDLLSLNSLSICIILMLLKSTFTPIK